MTQYIGEKRSTYGLDKHGLKNLATEHWNLGVEAITELAVKRGEGQLGLGGVLMAETGEYTGRSPKDKFFVVEPSSKDKINWGAVNQPISQEKFDELYERVTKHLEGKDVFVRDCWCGADERYRLGVRVINEQAWHNMFAGNMFIEASDSELENFAPDFTVLQAPSFKAEDGEDELNSEVFCLVDLGKKIILIGGTEYAGEIKKGIFGIMNYLLPQQGIMPMHCSANADNNGDSAIFFGLSGTGKTTLSSDQSRQLIGDDEHGWSDDGIFNMEGGCYAKVINLSAKAEPEIYSTTSRFGTILENVVYDENSRVVDFDDGSLTENTRASYPINFIPNFKPNGKGNTPKNVIMLTCDAFGVLPPVSKLTKEQAMYQFISGYTAKVAGTERGITEPTTTFSACFGGVFMPLHPAEYAELLGEKLEKNDVNCWLVNTGWSGGGYGVGSRMKIKHTRAMINAILDGTLAGVDYVADPVFGLHIPQSCGDVPISVLNPRESWTDKNAYDATAEKLAGLFAENFKKYEDRVSQEVLAQAIGKNLVTA